MNMINSCSPTMYVHGRKILFCNFCLKYHGKSKNCKYFQKDIHLGQNTLIHCSRITAWSYIAFLFGLMLKVPVNNFSIMLGRSHRFLSITSTFFFFFSFFFFLGGGG